MGSIIEPTDINSRSIEDFLDYALIGCPDQNTKEDIKEFWGSHLKVTENEPYRQVFALFTALQVPPITAGHLKLTNLRNFFTKGILYHSDARGATPNHKRALQHDMDTFKNLCNQYQFRFIKNTCSKECINALGQRYSIDFLTCNGGHGYIDDHIWKPGKTVQENIDYIIKNWDVLENQYNQYNFSLREKWKSSSEWTSFANIINRKKIGHELTDLFDFILFYEHSVKTGLWLQYAPLFSKKLNDVLSSAYDETRMLQKSFDDNNFSNSKSQSALSTLFETATLKRELLAAIRFVYFGGNMRGLFVDQRTVMTKVLFETVTSLTKQHLSIRHDAIRPLLYFLWQSALSSVHITKLDDVYQLNKTVKSNIDKHWNHIINTLQAQAEPFISSLRGDFIPYETARSCIESLIIYFDQCINLLNEGLWQPYQKYFDTTLANRKGWNRWVNFCNLGNFRRSSKIDIEQQPFIFPIFPGDFCAIVDDYQRIVEENNPIPKVSKQDHFEELLPSLVEDTKAIRMEIGRKIQEEQYVLFFPDSFYFKLRRDLDASKEDTIDCGKYIFNAITFLQSVQEHIKRGLNELTTENYQKSTDYPLTKVAPKSTKDFNIKIPNEENVEEVKKSVTEVKVRIDTEKRDALTENEIPEATINSRLELIVPEEKQKSESSKKSFELLPEIKSKTLFPIKEEKQTTSIAETPEKSRTAVESQINDFENNTAERIQDQIKFNSANPISKHPYIILLCTLALFLSCYARWGNIKKILGIAQ